MHFSSNNKYVRENVGHYERSGQIFFSSLTKIQTIDNVANFKLVFLPHSSYQPDFGAFRVSSVLTEKKMDGDAYYFS